MYKIYITIWTKNGDIIEDYINSNEYNTLRKAFENLNNSCRELLKYNIIRNYEIDISAALIYKWVEEGII